MNGLLTPTKDRFDIFREWLQDLGGSYEFYRPEPEPRAAGKPVYEPAHKPVLRPLNPKFYYVDGNGSVRKRARIMDRRTNVYQ